MSPSSNAPEILTTYPRSGLLKKSAAVDFLGLSTRTFERYVMRRVPRIRVGGQYLYPEEGLRAWIEANRVEPQPGPRLKSVRAVVGQFHAR